MPRTFWTLPPRRSGRTFPSQNSFEAASPRSALVLIGDILGARIGLGSKSSRNHKPLRAAKLNQIHRDGQLNDSFGLPLAPSTVNASHKLAECQLLTGRMGFHRHFLLIFNHIPTL